MVFKILGPSPLAYTLKKVNKALLVRAGDSSTNDICLSDEDFFEILLEEKTKPPRLTNREVQKLFDPKAKLTKNQKLLKSVIEDCELRRVISEKDFKNAKEMYEFRRKYKNYLRIKRIVPLSIVAPVTGNELTKMAFAAALGSKSISLSLSGVIGYSLPAFFFFHMSYFYVPDKIKPICTVCKYTIGAPFWIICVLVDEISSSSEEQLFGEAVPIDVTETGGTIPQEIGDFNKLRDVLEDMKKWGGKTY